MSRYNKKAKPRRPPLQSTRLLDQLRERIRYLHYSINTEKSYVYWVRMFVRWHKLCHPAEMGKAEEDQRLTYLSRLVLYQNSRYKKEEGGGFSLLRLAEIVPM